MLSGELSSSQTQDVFPNYFSEDRETKGCFCPLGLTLAAPCMGVMCSDVSSRDLCHVWNSTEELGRSCMPLCTRITYR